MGFRRVESGKRVARGRVWSLTESLKYRVDMGCIDGQVDEKDGAADRREADRYHE